MASTLSLHAQYDQPSVGAGYSNTTFYNLSDGNTSSVNHNLWDIAFSVGSFDLGVFVNEAVSLSFTNPQNPVELYATSSTDFAAVDTAGMERIYNNEFSWSAGAFNHVATPGNPADYGWGDYNFTTHQVIGSRVYVIKLRSLVYKKIMIESLISGVYTFKYANLDGSDEQTATIDKADYAGKTLAYYSLESNTTGDFEPAQWDLMFTRYSTPLDSGSGIVDYTVTGVLSNQNVTVAKASGVDPATVDYLAYENDYSDTLTAVGYDWKSYQGSWVIPQDLVYFIKTSQDELWQVQFIDFEGSATGVSTLQKTFLTTITNTDEQYENLNSFDVFPNPATDLLNISFELNANVSTGHLRVFNALGQEVMSEKIGVTAGLNVHQFNVDQLANGNYFISLIAGNEIITKPVIVQN